MATHALRNLFQLICTLPTLEFDPAHDGKIESSARRKWTSSESLFTEADANEKEDLGVEYVHGWKLSSLIVAVTPATFVVLLDISIIATVCAHYTNHYVFRSLPDVAWHGAAYNLSRYVPVGLTQGVGRDRLISASPQPLSGRLYTYFKTKQVWKWIFVAFLLLFQIGSLICGIAGSSTMFILGRAVTGLGSAGLQNGAFTIIRHNFDLPDFAFFAPSAITALLALEYCGSTYPWSSATVIALLVGGVATLGVFLSREKRAGDNAMVPLIIIRKREIWTACLTMHTGHYLPFAVASAVIVTIGSGLLATLDPFAPTAQWVGCEVFVPIRANTPARLVGMATATMVFCQTFSGAIN
ncbi:MFS transporter [Metarhizium robertsii]|uniref:MFS transporter n=1 Tax=Metarhizium robertsii TaxID=568076 RepID=A0A0A1V126_9HYPO|nr:MFS transporter [Metarhizium robertsii]